MKRYSITNWDGIYENHETRKLDNLRWIPQPNKHDGLGFRRMAQHKDAAELLAAWTLIVQVASKGSKGRRGNLERDGVPLSASDLAMITGFPERIFTRAFDFFTQPQSGWLKVEDTEPEELQCQMFTEITGENPGASRQPTSIGEDRIGKGMEGKVLKEGGGAATNAASPAAATESDPVLLEFPVVGQKGEPWAFTNSFRAKLADSYPNVDVFAQAKLALAKITTGAVTKKTAGGMTKFLWSWMDRVQNSARGTGSPGQKPGRMGFA